MFKSKPPPEFQTVVLKVSMHCEGCSKKVVKALQNMDNVEEYDVDLGEQKVRVTGRVDAKKVAKRLQRKTGKHSEVWEEKSLSASRSSSSRKSWKFSSSFRDSFKRATTIFSDEDTNSCSIM